MGKNKRTITIPVIPVIIFGILLALLVWGFLEETNLFSNIDVNNDNKQADTYPLTQEKQDCAYVNVPYEAVERYTEEESYTDEECTQKAYSYAIENFNADTFDKNCNQFGFNCDHYIGCVLDIVNHENQGGYFTINPGILKDGLDIGGNLKDITTYVYAQSEEKIFWQQLIGKDETPKCTYNIAKIPEKTTCKNVIKYKTAYKSRTITKWKQEYQCT